MASAGGIRMGGVFVEIGADTKAFFAAIGSVDKRLQKLGSFGVGTGLASMFKAFNGLSKTVTQAGRAMSGLGSQMSVAGVALAAPVGLAARQFASFDDAIRATAAVTGSLGADGAAAFAMLNDKARDLGATTSFTAIEVANLMTELGRAGFKPDEINAMTAAVLDLSRATGTNATRSAGIMAASLRQFELGAGDAARVADILTYTANNTFNTVDSLGESLKYAGPVAKSLGMSLEDTAAILGVLGNVGIQGSEAGTALRRLSVISSGAGQKLQDLFGVSNADAAGNLKPLVEILDEINTATRDMPVADRTARMAKAFGLLGITSANVLSRSAGGVRKLADGLQTADGVAMKTAKAMDAGLGGSVRIALSAIEGTALAIGDALAPSLQTAVDFIERLSTGITGFIKENESLVVFAAKAVAGVIALGTAFYAIGTAVSVAGGLIGAILSPLGLLAAGIAALVVTTPELSAAVTATFGEVSSIVGTTMTGIYDAIVGGDLGGAMTIAMEGLMAAWLAGTADIQSAFAAWSAQFQNGFTDLGVGIAVAWEHMWSQLAQTANWWNITLSNDELKRRNDNIQATTDRNVSAMESDGRRTVAARTANAVGFAEDLRGRAAVSQGRLAEMARGSRDRRIMSAQADSVISSVGEAKSMADLRMLADEFFTLRDMGMVSDAQFKKYGDAVDIASERVTPTASGGQVPAVAGGGVVPPNPDAIGAAATAAATRQSEVAGTFSSVNLSGMGFGSSIAQQQLEVLRGIKANTDDIGDEGAIAP